MDRGGDVRVDRRARSDRPHGRRSRRQVKGSDQLRACRGDLVRQAARVPDRAPPTRSRLDTADSGRAPPASRDGPRSQPRRRPASRRASTAVTACTRVRGVALLGVRSWVGSRGPTGARCTRQRRRPRTGPARRAAAGLSRRVRRRPRAPGPSSAVTNRSRPRTTTPARRVLGAGQVGGAGDRVGHRDLGRLQRRGRRQSRRPRQSSSGASPAAPIATSVWPTPPGAAEGVG